MYQVPVFGTKRTRCTCLWPLPPRTSSPEVHAILYRQLSAPDMVENTIEQGQSPSARAAHHRRQNTSVAPAGPAAPRRSAGVPLATSAAAIAPFFVRPKTTPTARAPQAPTAALEEPATATRSHASRSSESCGGHSVCGPGTARRFSSPGTSVCDPLLSTPP